MPEPFAVAERLVDDVAAHDPLVATFLGIPGADHRWPALDPDWHKGLGDLLSAVRHRLTPHHDHADRQQRLAARVLDAYLGEHLVAMDAGDHLRDLAHLGSQFQQMRSIFDVMDTSTEGGREAIRARLSTIDRPLAGYRETLTEGLRRGLPASRRQAGAVLTQARSLAGAESAWLRLAQLEPRDDMAEAVDTAKAAMAEFASWLESDYLPAADPADGVGRDRYLRAAERIVGLRLDPEEVYAWGWEELERIRARMRQVGAEIAPDATDPRQVADLLESDPDRAVHSPEELVAFVADRQETALAELDGVRFDVPPEIRQVDVRIAPPGGALGAYYFQPSEDFSRPGGIWYSVGDQTSFPLYQEVSTAYHEGFPGHHLQIGTAMAQRDRLSRAHRLLVWYSGYGEGWGLYAERLMEELGYYERPDYVFGMLASHVFRAARVVVDIGLHLGLTIPTGAPLAAGERWDFDLGVRYMHEVGLQPPDYAHSEVIRYLGWPGQAISYKVGERELLALRDDARHRFDLRDFHRRVLGDGEVRFELLRELVLDPEGSWS